MKREYQIHKAAEEYINSDAVPAENMSMAYGDFTRGAEWADAHPNQQMVEQMRCTLKDVHKMLDEMLEDYDDARLGIVYRVLDSVIEDLELLIDEEE